MEKLLIPLGIIMLMSFLGYLTQLLKKAADRRQGERDRERVREQAQKETIRTGSADIDRYLRAVDAQRQRAAAPPRPVPTVPPVRKPRLADSPAATAFPQAKLKPAAKAPAALPDDLPVATVVEPTTSVTAPAQLAKLAKPERATAAPEKPRTEPTSPFAKQLVGTLRGPNAAAMAVVLHEVFGPPKCKRG